MPYSGKTKIEFCDRLGKEWRKLADFLEISPHDCDSFEKGHEAAEIWEWLERREKHGRLPDALTFIHREDLVKLLEPDITPSPSAQVKWKGSPYPGLLPFKSDEAPIFFGRDKEIRELIERLRNPANRFLAVIGASGSGKSSLVAAGLIPRLGEIAGGPWLLTQLTPGELLDFGHFTR